MAVCEKSAYMYSTATCNVTRTWYEYELRYMHKERKPHRST